jgi:hypothetical protein
MFTNRKLCCTWLCTLPLGWDAQWCISLVLNAYVPAPPKQLLFGKTFGTCQSNIIFVEFASLKTIFRRIPGVVSIQI